MAWRRAAAGNQERSVALRSVAELPPCTTRVWQRFTSPDSSCGAAFWWRHRSRWDAPSAPPPWSLEGALFLTLAIVSLHFTAMGAASIVRGSHRGRRGINSPTRCDGGRGRFGWSRNFGASLTGVGLDRRDQRRAAASVRDMAAAKRASEYQNLLIAELDHRAPFLAPRCSIQCNIRSRAAAENFSAGPSTRSQT